MRCYKDTFVAKGCALWNALESSVNGFAPEAKKIYDETTEAFIKLYGKDDAAWFMSKHKEYLK